jgi:hypothetical protein
MNDEGLCPACREHCDWVEEDREDATQELRAFGKDAAHKLAAHLHEMKAAKAMIRITINSVKYVVTVERQPTPCTDEHQCIGCYTGTGCTNPANNDLRRGPPSPPKDGAA